MHFAFYFFFAGVVFFIGICGILILIETGYDLELDNQDDKIDLFDNNNGVGEWVCGSDDFDRQ